MKKFLICSTALTLLAAAPVHAQSYSSANNAKDHDSTLGSADYVQPQKQADAAQPATAPEAIEPSSGSSDTRTSNFTGPYVGGEFGYNWARTDVDVPGGSLGSADMHGWGGGGFAGYGTTISRLNNMYLGGEVGYNWISASDDAGGVTVRERNDFRATVRPGLAMDNFLGYGIAGYTRASFDADPGDNHDLNGYVLGLGAEADTHTPVKARVEYTYSGFAHSDMGPGLEIHPHDNEVRVGLLYQFH